MVVGPSQYVCYTYKQILPMYWCSIALICSSVNAHRWANFFHSPGLSCLWANFRNIISRFSSVSCSVIETSKSGLHFHFLRSSGVFGLVLFCTQRKSYNILIHSRRRLFHSCVVIKFAPTLGEYSKRAVFIIMSTIAVKLPLAAMYNGVLPP